MTHRVRLSLKDLAREDLREYAPDIRKERLLAIARQQHHAAIVELAQDIVQNLVSTDSCTPEAEAQYLEWTIKRLKRAAGQ